ncbi:concanavalin A-like lectin/glucanase superfamily protein [Breoghania corrubedonensis]|uniref:Concanavalin A-like lectin/glucanase superfamily protein n=1 Tax=Breoghania corrubedonensis TaxID=665038 RepID=A0A2T5VGA3_9HYPH|nr:LamG domain-containing protein [Breoghania corrubedonensis]PTW62797.1 concanavalin A-like lectin/glucanase superfamily protein [Breoghania corrubedonensis]
MISYSNPTAVRHQGRGILIAERTVRDDAGTVTKHEFVYNVLSGNDDVVDDGLGWQGFFPLPDNPQQQTSLAGFSVLRLLGRATPRGPVQVVSDETHVYLFRALKQTLLVERFLLVETSNANARDGRGLALEPDWEVRFRRSASADLPASDNDVSAYRSPEGAPFLNPRRYLSFAPGEGSIDLETGFSVVLMPGSQPGGTEWRIFTGQGDRTQLNVYVVPRLSDGWFDLGATSLDEAGRIQPRASFELSLEKSGKTEPLVLTGFPATALYQQLEPMVSSNDEAVQMRTVNRLLLACPAKPVAETDAAPVSDGDALLLTLDFEVDVAGGVAFDGAMNQPLFAGPTAAEALSVDFPLPSDARIAAPIRLPGDFTLQAWLSPQRGPVGGDTANETRQVLGGSQSPETRAPTLEIVNQFRVRASFGTGSEIVSTMTLTSVLGYGTWCNVTATYDGNAFRIFVNGSEVEVETQGPLGARPAGGAIDRVGLSHGGFVGQMTEARVWSRALSLEEILDTVFTPLSGPAERTGLEAYWPMDGGTGTTIEDASGNGHDAMMAGCVWSGWAAPLARPDRPINQIDAKSRAVSAGLLTPEDNFPGFGAVAPNARPAVLSTGDGPLHVYYPGPGRVLSVARCSGVAARAFFVGGWTARDGTSVTQETGGLAFVTRQTGAYNSFSSIKIKEAPGGITCDVEFNGPGADTRFGGGAQKLLGRSVQPAIETWKGVARRVDLFEQTLNGRAVGDPNDPRISQGTAVFYDYSGMYRQALLRLGATALLSAVRFASLRPRGLVLAALSATQAGDELTVSVTLESDTGTPVHARLGPVPATAAALVDLFRGTSGDAAYAANAASTPVWGLPGTSRHLFVIARRWEESAQGSKPAVSAARFTLTPGSSFETADFEAELTLTNDVIRATWSQVPRDGEGFIAALQAGTAAEQKQVLAELIFLEALEGQLLNVNAATVTNVSDLRYVTGLVGAIREGGDGEIGGSFSLQADVLQGVEGRSATPGGTIASGLFSVQPVTRPNRGYAAAVDPGETGGTIVLASPGRNGGWLRDPPRYAMSFDGTGALGVDLDALVPAPDVYEQEGPVTIEAWLRPAESRWVPSVADETAQSVLHFSSGPDGIGYGLSYRPSETPRFFRDISFEISDATVPADQTDDKLVREGAYTMQVYLRPMLLWDGESWFFRRLDGTEVLEELSIAIPAVNGGQPTHWSLVFSCGGQKVATPADIAGGAWTMVTLVRDNETVILYVNGEEAARSDDIAMPDAEIDTFVFANPSEVFEFEPNEFSAWNIARNAEEIRTNYLRPLGGSETGLVALFPMSRAEPNHGLINRSRWTSTVYDTVLGTKSLSPFFTRTGLFFDVIAQCGGFAATTTSASLSPHRWRHIAATLVRRGALLTGNGSAKTDGKHKTQLGEGFSVDARVCLSSLASERQVIASRFQGAEEDQIYELGIQSNGRAYITVRLSRAAESSSSPGSVIFTFFSDLSRRIETGTPHHVAASLRLVTLTDKTDGLQVTALDASVYVDGLGLEQISPPAAGVVNDYRLVTVIGGRGSGYYMAGQTVRIEADDASRFTRWYGTVEFEGGSSSNAQTTFVMPEDKDFRDVVIAANAFTDPMKFADAPTRTRVGISGPPASGNDQPSGTGALHGQISDVRLWTRALRPNEVEVIASQPGATPYDDDLLSWWRFDEQSGRIAKDSVGDNDLKLTSSTLWGWFDGASVSIFADGDPIATAGMSIPLKSSSHRQMGIGGRRDDNGTLSATMRGQLDELRLWRSIRSGDEIVNNMARYLTGAETGLMGYWRFDTGSGDIVVDRTVHLGNARKYDIAGAPAAIQWTASEAPIGFDAPVVDDTLDTRSSPEAIELADAAAAIAVFEYADTLTTGAGEKRSVLKRSYIYEGIGGLADETGYKVGDLERVYVGQIQSDPSVIGYIEGAPPLPSENLIRPLTAAPYVHTYAGISSVTLNDTQSQNVVLDFSSSRVRTTDIKFTGGGGVAGKNDAVLGVPPVQSAVRTTEAEVNISTHIQFLKGSNSGSGDKVNSAAVRSQKHTLSNGGSWEARSPDGRYFLESGERRYVPSNVGSALVKSRVADLFALKLQATGALVSMSVEPNPDIPEDINIIRFPIDPLYQLAGSLDGRIGLQKAPQTETSYYKPRDAYTLKDKVERQRQALKSYFESTDLGAIFEPETEASSSEEERDPEILLQQARDSAIARNPAFSSELETPLRDMVNTYVWVAGGGTYAESEGFSTELTETYSVGRSDTTSGGMSFAFDYMFASGKITGGFGLVGSLAKAFNVTKTFSRNRAMTLEISASPDGFPHKYDAAGEDFSDELIPGRVTSYRFMTFFLANEPQNASDLFTTVIDQKWLNQSQDPNAAALREARAAADNIAPWRIMHRVTYVSRIPPAFQAVPTITDEIATPEAPNQAHNAVFLYLVRAKLSTTEPVPASAISTAVRDVLESDLPLLLPWWGDYLTEASVENSAAQGEYAGILGNAVAYAVSVIGATA